ncbi:uncharacterized protein AB675_10453 [Cyphellophora attinorum]|uniref:Uncharacterized protein n=1 Tax=Cyphellophora attinorum TaxID=1664694 RepID=A0A0N1NWV2_9EURO|nr:uncharacterized protein AB675_10453 [Phialophora attinorum]KPI35915.1 hypothetical protein AB675_10453 [Phialophora attinorum]
MANPSCSIIQDFDAQKISKQPGSVAEAIIIIESKELLFMNEAQMVRLRRFVQKPSQPGSSYASTLRSRARSSVVDIRRKDHCEPGKSSRRLGWTEVGVDLGTSTTNATPWLKTISSLGAIVDAAIIVPAVSVAAVQEESELDILPSEKRRKAVWLCDKNAALIAQNEPHKLL